jgi:hypothetical protein
LCRASTLALLASIVLIASCSGSESTTSSEEDDAGASAQPAAMVPVSGDDEAGEVAEELPEPLGVRVENATGGPVEGATRYGLAQAVPDG